MKTVRTPDEQPSDRRGPMGALARPLPRPAKPDADADADNGFPGAAAIGIPRHKPGPLKQVVRRFALALLVLAVTVLLVWIERDGYRDSVDDHLSFLDAVYYATVTLSTTGYGDVTPASDGARLMNIVLITPLRVVFLIILVGTTLEVLTERTREQWRLSRWRSTLRDHTVVVGYGTTGYSAISTLVAQGVPRDRIVVVDPDAEAVAAAMQDGLVAVAGDATRADVLRRAEFERARNLIVSANRDDTAALVTLTARQINRRAWIVVAVREDENSPLIRQSGADSVVTTASAAGRLLGVSMLSPNVGEVVEDLLHYGSGMDLIERPVEKRETGKSPAECRDLVVAVVRGHRMLRHDDPEASKLATGDRLVVIRSGPRRPDPMGPRAHPSPVS